MVKICIKLDKEIYELLAKLEKEMQALINYFETIEIQVCDEKVEKEELKNAQPPKT